MRPAGERLEAERRAVLQRHDRLEAQRDFVVLDGDAQVGLQSQPFDGLVVHARFKQREPSLAALLRAVHRDVGVAQHVVGALRTGIPHDADAGADGDFGAVELHGLLHRFQHAFRHAHAVRRLAHLVDQYREFVATQARDRVASPRGVQQASADLEQQLVAGGMAHRVVDGLEVVEVQEEHGHAARRNGAPAERLFHTFTEEGTVGEVRERIVKRLPGELRLQCAALGDVLQHCDQPR